MKLLNDLLLAMSVSFIIAIFCACTVVVLEYVKYRLPVRRDWIRFFEVGFLASFVIGGMTGIGILVYIFILM